MERRAAIAFATLGLVWITTGPVAAQQAPPATDIFLFDLGVRAGKVTLGVPVQVTNREGYDNQPSFSPDGKLLYYTSIGADGQAEIQRYAIASRETKPVTTTPESEYSPTVTPDGRGLSVVRVEADKTQRLWQFPLDGGPPELLLPELKPVGYHVWGDANTLVLFILGQPPTLQVADRRTGKAEVVASDVGRCLRKVPGRNAVSFVRKVSAGEWWIEELDLASHKTSRVARTPQGSEDYAWMPDGRLLMGYGAKLLEGAPGPRAVASPAMEWHEVAAFSDPALQVVSRLAVSPAGDRLALVADRPARFELTVDSIMRGPKLVGFPPTSLRWSGDSRELFFEWRQPGEDEAATWVVGNDGKKDGAKPDSLRRSGAGGLRGGAAQHPGGLRGGAAQHPPNKSQAHRLGDEERRLAPGADGVWDRARRRVLFVDRGDIALVDTVARTRRQITRTTAAEGNPRWARGESHVSFTRENNLYLVPADGSGDLVVQLTDVGPKKKEPKLTESQTFLKEEERKLLKHVAEAADRKKREEERKEKAGPPRFEIQEKQSVADAALSEDGRYAWLLVGEAGEGAKTAEVPDYVTESSYPAMITSRTRVGDRQDTRRLAILDLQTGKSVWATVEGVPAPEPAKPREDGTRATGDSSTSASEGGAKPQAEASAGDVKPIQSQGREVRWSVPLFSKDGRTAVATVRAADNKDRWLVAVDPATGKGRVVDRLHDDAWIREGFGGGSGGSFGWMPDDRRVWFLSERDGWQHLYTADATTPGTSPTALTSGRFEVFDARLSPDGKGFYVTTSEVHPGERHLYRLPLEGGARTRLTAMPGANQAEVSPDEATIAFVHSEGNAPPEVFLAPLEGGVARRVTTSTSADWRAFPWTQPAIVTIGARDGAQVPARLYTPESVGAKRDPLAPGVVFIHGAGYLQNAHRYWSQYFREYMFHHLLASRGYVVLDVDYRGSAGYGRDWRAAIARHMGGKDLDDVVDGARYLVDKHGVDARRIGVYGGSYGGFLTLMAMFTSPDTFAAGAALRPVTDWAHYSHPYTASILNEPQSDTEAYRRSSPIYFAEGLKGALLICHGMVDTNVHFSDSVRLAQRLIELRKEDWEVASYPVENHAFEEETSWADEYKRILRLFERRLRGKVG